MRYKIYYNKGLKMSPSKLASQIAHVTLNLGYDLGVGEYGDCYFSSKDQVIVVLGLSATKFKQKVAELDQLGYSTGMFIHIQDDLGITEVDAGTITACGYIE